MLMIKGLVLWLLAASCESQSTSKHGTMDLSNFDVQILWEIQLLRSDLQKSNEQSERLAHQTAQLVDDITAMKEELMKQGIALKAQGKSFSTYLTTSVSPDAGEKIIFDGIEHNEGGHYDSDTGSFRCPLNGTYFFTMMLYANIWSNPDGIHYNLVHQEKIIGQVHCDNYSEIDIYNMCGNSAVIYCHTGEEVYVQCYEKGNTVAASDRRTTFTGFLLHTD